MTEKTNLRRSEYNLFKLITEAPLGQIRYKKLAELSGKSRTAFCNSICFLSQAGLISKTGGTKNKTVHANKRLDEVQIGPVQVDRIHIPLNTAKPKSNKYKGQEKSRKCLKCRTEFKSEWPGERICKACKTSRAWTDDNQFTPTGDGDGFGVSSLVTGVI
ncbi:hypothetical protein WH95_18465 [Kiloniella litopenaei]|uniref:Uncharacterized protein n=1 Tax=Kiloniella litopenaei TaxID=1549748 RepID=A0A0M2R1A4_9PROT|nr:hypothetical protein [Kiloniella litopenaei]KKJ75426.1 hypothetical protein WH95_18465 [Kiloniella litopenaei]